MDLQRVWVSIDNGKTWDEHKVYLDFSLSVWAGYSLSLRLVEVDQGSISDFLSSKQRYVWVMEGGETMGQQRVWVFMGNGMTVALLELSLGQ